MFLSSARPNQILLHRVSQMTGQGHDRERSQPNQISFTGQYTTLHNETHKQTLGVFAEVRSHRINTNGSRLHQRSSLAVAVLFTDSAGSDRHQNLVINQLLAGSGLGK